MFGYIDESGVPGIATYPRDYFVVSLVIFRSEEDKNNAVKLMENLRERLKLPVDYEFHCSHNSTRVQDEFLKILSRMNFRFITIGIKKDSNKKTASYNRMAQLIIEEIIKRFDQISIEMDKNPALFSEIKNIRKSRRIKGLSIKERNSRGNQLIQVADYVVNISAKKIKNTAKSKTWYSHISNKLLAFIEIAS